MTQVIVRTYMSTTALVNDMICVRAYIVMLEPGLAPRLGLTYSP